MLCSYPSSTSYFNCFTEIEEWHKREIIRDKMLLKKYPSIIKYMAGQIDGDEFVKVYLSEDNEGAKDFFKTECRKVLRNPEFDFVNVNEMSKRLEDNEKEVSEEEVPKFEESDRMKLIKVIQLLEEEIYAKYSNVIGIDIGNVRRVDTMQNGLGVIFYCLDEKLIPFGENPIPKILEEWPCNVKEDFFMLGACPKTCPSTNKNHPIPGCSIGIPEVACYGSTGFLYKSNTPTSLYGSGFLTASHVAIEDCHKLYLSEKSFSNHALGKKKHDIVHHLNTENRNEDIQIGNVVESYFGNYGKHPTCLDLAVVKFSNNSRKTEGNILLVFFITLFQFSNFIFLCFCYRCIFMYIYIF